MGAIIAVHIHGHVSVVRSMSFSLGLHIPCCHWFHYYRILQGSPDAEDIKDGKDGGPEFAEVFVIVWIGSMIVTLNSKLLGGNM